MKLDNFFVVFIRHEVFTTENRLDLDIRILSQKENDNIPYVLILCKCFSLCPYSLYIKFFGGSNKNACHYKWVSSITSHIKSLDSRSLRIYLSIVLNW